MISIPQEQFRKAAAFAGSVIYRRNTIPVLSTIKVTANGSLVFEGTDLDTFARAECPYDGEAGEFLIGDPAKVAKAVKASGASDVEFTVEGMRLKIEAGDLSADLCTLPADDHPGYDRITEEQFGATIGEGLFKLLDRVRPAICTEETRYYLNGIFIHKVADWTYRFVATDGHRLFFVDVPLPDATGDLPDGVIIPKRFIDKAMEAFSGAPEGIRLSVGLATRSNRDDKTLTPASTGMPRISFSGPVGGMKLELTSKLIDGTYPDYKRVVPASHEYALRVAKSELVRAISSLTPLSTDKTRAVKITLGKGNLTVDLNSPDIGKSSFTIAAEHGTPDGFQIGFNARYLLDTLASLSGDEVELRLTDSGSPTTIVDPSDTAFTAVLMPMRV